MTIVQYWAGCPTMPNSKWQRFLRLAQACAERGWRTVMVWSRMPEDAALAQPFRDAGCEIALLPRPRRNFDPACIVRAYRLFRRVRPQVVHVHNVHTSPLIAAALARVPVRVWSKLSMSRHYEEGRTPRGLERLQLSVRLSAALSRRVLCIASAVRQELLDLGLPADKLLIEPPSVDVERYASGRPDGVREGLGIPADAVVITTVGRSAPVKGWDILVEAFGQLAPQVPKAHLLLVGSTSRPDERDLAEELRRRVMELGIAERVTFAGQRADVPNILAASDIFVLPSRSEGRPNALLEAMAAGVPCIAARIADASLFGPDCMLFERGHGRDLSRCIIRAINMPHVRSAALFHSPGGQWDCAEASSWKAAVYEDLLTTSGRRRHVLRTLRLTPVA